MLYKTQSVSISRKIGFSAPALKDAKPGISADFAESQTGK